MDYRNDFDANEITDFEAGDIDNQREFDLGFSLEEGTKKDNLDTKYESICDPEIIAMYKAGDEMAFEHLVKKYRYLVSFKIRHNYLRGADKDDLLQEGIIGLYKAIRDYDPNKAASFKVFAELCVTRQINSAIKMATRQKHIPLNSYMSLNAPNNDNGDRQMFDVMDIGGYDDPMETLIDNETFSSLEVCACRELSDFELKVLSLYLNNCSYHRISELTSKSVKSVDNALQRIKKKIEKIVKENDLDA